jgi:twitching motility protein PilU
VNYFRQRGNDGFVIRKIETSIKSLDDLNLPVILKELSMKDRGLVLVVGATGSGKSTTLAAMIDQRNSNKSGHILTLEDPIEFLHEHKKSIINQREVGTDTDSYARALKSALREAPSVLLIGEIRDQESMQAALSFSETGHLVFSTLHATNAPQTIERVMSFYEQAQHDMIQMQLSQNLLAIVAQRLVPTVDGKRAAALEIMLTSARIRDLIQKGSFELLRQAIEHGTGEGMQLFDQALHKLYVDKRISEEMAYEYADQPTDLRLKIASQEERQAQLEIELFEDGEDTTAPEEELA